MSPIPLSPGTFQEKNGIPIPITDYALASISCAAVQSKRIGGKMGFAILDVCFFFVVDGDDDDVVVIAVTVVVVVVVAEPIGLPIFCGEQLGFISARWSPKTNLLGIKS